MLVIKQKSEVQAVPEVVVKAHEKMDTRQKIDRLGELKLVIDAVNPSVKEYDKLKKELTLEYKEEGDVDSELEVMGNAFKIVLGSRPNQRAVTDLYGLFEIVGEELFMKMVTVGLTELDKYVAKSEQEKILTWSRGNRSLKTVTSVVG